MKQTGFGGFSHFVVPFFASRQSLLGRDDFNLTFMIFSGELPYDVGYPKKHIRPYGGGWGLLLYPAQQSPCWLNLKIGVFF